MTIRVTTIDNTSSRNINGTSKHVDVIYLSFIQEKIDDGTIIPSVQNLADICTKGLAKPLFSSWYRSNFSAVPHLIILEEVRRL